MLGAHREFHSSVITMVCTHVPYTNTHKSLFSSSSFPLHLLLRMSLFSMKFQNYNSTHIRFFGCGGLWVGRLLLRRVGKRRNNADWYSIIWVYFSSPSVRRRRPWVGRQGRWMRQTSFCWWIQKRSYTKKISCWVFRLRLPISAYFFFFFSPLHSTTSRRSHVVLWRDDYERYCDEIWRCHV